MVEGGEPSHEVWRDGEPVELGRILAARFNHVGRDYYGFRFASGEKVDFYDETGNSLRKAFLKAPLKYERISSRYTLKRFHPVQKRWKAHLGTDYAAPTGTRVRAVEHGGAHADDAVVVDGAAVQRHGVVTAIEGLPERGLPQELVIPAVDRCHVLATDAGRVLAMTDEERGAVSRASVLRVAKLVRATSTASSPPASSAGC